MHLIAEGEGTRHAVFFVSGPEVINPGDEFTCDLCLAWFPEDSYDPVKPGANFVLFDGPYRRAVGTVVRRYEAPPCCLCGELESHRE